MGKWLEKFSTKTPIPPTATLDRLSIVSSVSVHDMPVLPKLGAWDATDWREYFDERAGILEHDGKHTRHEAERIAYETCIVRWLNENPPAHTDINTCPECRKQNNQDSIAVLKKGGHIWLHDKCHAGWITRRRQDAARVLETMGININKLSKESVNGRSNNN